MIGPASSAFIGAIIALALCLWALSRSKVENMTTAFVVIGVGVTIGGLLGWALE